jgi:uncharacterized membrane protein
MLLADIITAILLITTRLLSSWQLDLSIHIIQQLRHLRLLQQHRPVQQTDSSSAAVQPAASAACHKLQSTHAAGYYLSSLKLTHKLH